MNKNSEIYRILTKIYPLLFLLSFVFLNLECKNPEEYEPGDPSQPPPSAPDILLPLSDTTFYGTVYPVIFDWTSIDGAERYEIELDTNSFFSAGSLYTTYSHPFTIQCIRYHSPKTTYFFRIRGGSSLWTYYTDWSEIRVFHIHRDL